MDYNGIVALALSYADRSDTSTTDRMDDFLKVVESRISRKLKTMDMVNRLPLPTVTDQYYYDLPSDFAGLREIKQLVGLAEITFNLANPQFMDGVKGTVTNKLYYSIVGDQLRINPPLDAGSTIELVHYVKVPSLASGTPNNWVSDDNPDCYVFGLMVEISSFVKDAEATAIWELRFKEAIEDISFNDSVTRWSGTPLEIKVG